MLTLPLAAAFTASVLATSFISGVFGMAGGMMLMGLLLVMVSVPQAMLLHGVAQFASNGWRAVLWRRHVHWRIVGNYAVAAIGTALLFATLRLTAGKAVAFLILGGLPFATYLLPASVRPDATRRAHAWACGVACTVPQLLSGVSGPLLDAFFVHSNLDRREVVATKAATQVFAHALKIAYFGAMLAVDGEGVAPALFAIAVVCAMIGTTLARRLLEAMSDAQFRRWTRAIVLTMAAIYLVQGLHLLWAAR